MTSSVLWQSWVLVRLDDPQSLKYLDSGFLQKKFADPYSKIYILNL